MIYPAQKNDIVRITSQGIVAEGPIHSISCAHVFVGEPGNARIMGYEPDAIEMYDIRGDKKEYRYWKSVDRGPHLVEVLKDDVWTQLYPRTIDGWTNEDYRLASKTYESYFGRRVGEGRSRVQDEAQLSYIFKLIIEWRKRMTGPIGYDDSMEVARTLDYRDRNYVGDVRMAYNGLFR